MGKLRDLTGMRFEKLLVIKRVANKGINVAWECLCDCGNTKVYTSNDLVYSDIKSCGCYRKEMYSKNNEDIIGNKYNRLTVLSFHEMKNGKYYYLCKCDCGNEKVVRKDSLKNGHTKSCGCYWEEVRNLDGERLKKHGQYETRLYSIWHHMKQRCQNPNNKRFLDYGGRGIEVCDEWNDFQNFYEWSINNGYTDDLTIDRINVNGNYEPDNCRWITNIEQQNNKRHNVIVTRDGVSHTVSEWSRILGISYSSAKYHLVDKNRTIEDIIDKYTNK